MCADRDGDLLAPPQMPLPEQYVGNPVVVRIDEQALHPPDLTIEGMDVLTGTYLCFTRRDNLLDNEPGRPRHGGTAGGLHAEGPNGSWSHHGHGRPRVAAFYSLFVLGVAELAELGEGATQPDFAGRGVDQVQGDKPAGMPPVPGLDDKMRDRISSRIDDHAADLAARTVRAACLGPDRESCLVCHCRLPLPGWLGPLASPGRAMRGRWRLAQHRADAGIWWTQPG